MRRIRSRAPLRLGLAGGGTDVSPYCDLHGGFVLNATIDLYAYCTIGSSSDNKVRFIATDLGQSAEYEVGEVPATAADLALHVACYRRIVNDFNGGKQVPLTVWTHCEVPAGSGLGSSSTIVVAMVQAFAEWFSLGLGEYDIAHLAYVIEREDAGLAGGRQDQYAAAFGGFNFMEISRETRVLVNPLRIKPWIIAELESSLVLLNTGHSRHSASILAEQSKNVRESNATAVEAMHRGKADALRMKECLLRGEIQQMARVMESAWESKKKMASTITSKKIDDYYQLALAGGAYCGKISGAGGGGFMMFLVEPTKRIELIQRFSKLDDGSRILSCHFTQSGSEAWTL